MATGSIFAKLAACIVGWDCLSQWGPIGPSHSSHNIITTFGYDKFPKADDPFQFIPCTHESLPPELKDTNPKQSWARLFDPNPDHWNWGPATSKHNARDAYDGRGIYLCGYLDLPIDYTNLSDTRITRIAVTKYQVSGLARRDGSSKLSTGRKSKRTMVHIAGGPGMSGTAAAWRRSEYCSKHFTNGQFDVLGWDPRGVNISQPSLSCYPHDAIRDRWALRSGYIFSGQFREVSPSPMEQLKFADAVNEAVFNGCKAKFGDFPRFVSTAFVARDLEQIRIALGEDELTSYGVSYGTLVSQIYANMFPNSVGRMVLDGVVYSRQFRYIDGIPRSVFDNGTDTWRDGFLNECLNAGTKYCALAKPIGGTNESVTLKDLQDRMKKLIWSLRDRPVPAYNAQSGPSVITYSQLVLTILISLLLPDTWPALAQALFELEQGDPTTAATIVDGSAWKYHPALSQPKQPSAEETRPLVLCTDAHYDPDVVDDLSWWDEKWQNLADASWIAGNELFNDVLACRQVRKLWTPAEVYTGDLNNTLKNPVLLVSGTYDPGSQLRAGRELFKEMGQNARLVVHDAYGHSSQSDISNCTNAIIRACFTEGKVPKDAETQCKADAKPYVARVGAWDPFAGTHKD